MPEIAFVVVAHESCVRGLRASVLQRLEMWGVALDEAARTRVEVVVSNVFAAALLHGYRGQTVTVRVSVLRGELAVEVRTGVTAYPLRRSPTVPPALPPVLTVFTTSAGVEDRARGRRFWATVDVGPPRPGRVRAALGRRWLRARHGMPARVRA
ncbi:hypothetical protein [Kitasatospora sp. NPDC088548]|uniref:hypothetical protein n=1 Tax=Kitasatospora sp. NPDC088548 TaxID=3364075 RepID=UPI003809DE33